MAKIIAQMAISCRPGTVILRNDPTTSKPQKLVVIGNETLTQVLTVRFPDGSTKRLKYPCGLELRAIYRPFVKLAS